MLSVIMLNVAMLNVVMLSVFMLSVLAPFLEVMSVDVDIGFHCPFSIFNSKKLRLKTIPVDVI
jgi:hypothetical protein